MSSQSKRATLKRRFAKSARVTSLLWLVGAGACTSVLGIEDLHEGPKPGTETNGGDGGSNTTDVKGGSKNGGSTNGGSANGGSSNAGAGNVGPGGEGGTSVTPAGGEAGVGGEGGAAPALTPVNGKIINEWGMPVGNVTVQIGATQAVTDDKGQFTIPDIADTYEVSLKNGVDGWVFQGLHRHDPTLQVISTDPDLSRGSDVAPKFTNTVKGINDFVAFAVGTATGNARDNDVDPVDPSFDDISVYWLGGNATSGTAHALQWTTNASTKLPVSYKAYDTKSLPLADGVNAMVSFDLKADVITAKAITGSATAAGNADHTNMVFIRFSSGAFIKLIEDSQPKSLPPAFSYTVPQLANASITFMTLQGSFSGKIGMVHKNGLTAGDVVGTLKSPRPATLLTPAPNAGNVAPTATFSLTPSAENSGAFMYVVSPETSPGRLFIVTTKTSLKGLPDVVNGAWILPTDSDIDWWVETHGNFATVDDMTGPAGFMDMFGLYYETNEPIGPGDQDGSWTSTEAYTFHSAM